MPAFAAPLVSLLVDLSVVDVALGEALEMMLALSAVAAVLVVFAKVGASVAIASVV